MQAKPSLALTGVREGWESLTRVITCLVLTLLALGVGHAYAQTRVVSGRVVGPDLSPLIGVNVVVQGTQIGTLTNASGGFQISAPSATSTLVFSLIGFR